jgi:hypothetical protein
MTSHGPDPLEQLSRLSRTSKFDEKVDTILRGEEYKQWAKRINDADAKELVEFLDKVRRCTVLSLRLILKFRRLLVILTMLVPVTGDACESSATSAAREGFYQHLTRFPLKIWPSVLNLSRREALAMCMKELLVGQKFA